MLEITIPAVEQGWDSEKEEFVYSKEQTLCLEHSLVSISKWESKWHKPFLGYGEKSDEEMLDYIRCMTITKGVPDDAYRHLTIENFEAIKKYIDNPMTATTINDAPNAKKSRDIITSEIIYHWMIAFNIPVEFQKWHINRLLTLIRVCDIKNSPAKKRSNRDILRSNAAQNAARRSKYHSKG